MTDSGETRIQEAEKTGVMSGLDRFESANPGSVSTLPGENPAPYKKEPLFSKRVMLGWAAATLIAWFAFTVVVPAVFRSVVEAVATSVDRNDDGTTTIETRNERITIRRDGEGVTVDRQPRTKAAPAPLPAVEPAAPAAPVAPGAPVPVPPTGKK